MSYCTTQHLIDRFGENELIQLTDEQNIGQIELIALTDAISDADGEIDSYLAVRYTLPISPIPKVLSRIACDITRYYLYDDRIAEHIEKRYQNAIKFLRSAAKGDISLGIDAAGDTPETSASLAEFTDSERVFSRSDKGFI